jgi:hypothetical protein
LVEIEWSVLVRQCLDRRLPDRATVQQVTTLWTEQRNHYRTTVDWRFTVHDARTKLVDLYPLQS